MTTHVGCNLTPEYIVAVNANCEPDISILDLIAEHANTPTGSTAIDRDGAVYNGQRWLDGREVARLIRWIERTS